MFSDELIDVVENKKEENTVGQILKRMIDGEPMNIDPLTEIPNPKMKLYGFLWTFESSFFDTQEGLIEYIKTHNTQFGSICVIEYLGQVAGRSDVIRLTYKSGKSAFYTPCDEYGYGIYNYERNVYRGEFIWEYNHGNISEIYSAFRDRGIVFENDIYAKISERNRKIMNMFEEYRKGLILTKKIN